MALTRIKISDVNTAITTIADPVIALNYGNAQPNTQDIGIVFNRGNATPNVGFIWNEETDQFQMVFTPESGNTGLGNIVITGYANVYANEIAGNVVIGNTFIGNGSQLTGVTAVIAGNLDGNISGNGYSISNVTYLSANAANATSLQYRLPVVETAVDYTATIENEVILANGQITITLPSASTMPGKIFTIKRISQLVTIIVSNNGLIDNYTSVQLTQQFAAIKLVAGSNNWWII